MLKTTSEFVLAQTVTRHLCSHHIYIADLKVCTAIAGGAITVSLHPLSRFVSTL